MGRDFFGTLGGEGGWLPYAILWLRIAFGVHCLLSGVNYFVPLVPPAPIQLSPSFEFISQLDAVGLYQFIKLVEICVGLQLIFNFYVPLALVFEMPTTVSIFYLNTFVDSAPRQLYTGPRELFYNMVLIAAYWAYFRPLLSNPAVWSPIWRGGLSNEGQDPVTGKDKGGVFP